MSDAVDADLARYDRECDEADRRELAIERAHTAAYSDPRALYEAATWLESNEPDQNTRAAQAAVGGVLYAAIWYGRASAGLVPDLAGALAELLKQTRTLEYAHSFDAALLRVAEAHIDDNANDDPRIP